jgi:hypothetical protein
MGKRIRHRQGLFSNRKRAIAYLLLLFCLFVLPGIYLAQADNTTYYLDVTSTKTPYSGTQSNPWNSVSSVNNHAAFLPGDKILIKRGTTVYATGTPTTRFTTTDANNLSCPIGGILEPQGIGSSSAQITIDAYNDPNKPSQPPQANPIIDLQGHPNRAGILLYDQQYWTIQNLQIINTSNTNPVQYQWGILVWEDGVSAYNNIFIINNTIQGIRGSIGMNPFPTSSPAPYSVDDRGVGGIYICCVGINATMNATMNNLKIKGNILTSIYGIGIKFCSSRPTPETWKYLSNFDTICGNTVTHTAADGIVVIV